jgi:exodeoxyribonuclease VII large subunit
MDDKALTLYQLMGQIKSALKNTLPFSWWVMAEISELKVNYSGHCYLELIEKDDAGESIKAKVRATIWSTVFRMIQPYFETTTNTRLSAGIKVMIKVNAEFHELYGFSLNITDIEPSFTIGELARQKQEIINRLKAEGVFHMNKSLTFPELPRKIAVISSKTAAGLGDFMDQLTGNSFGYKFHIKLFPAVMQGDEGEQSIIHALERIYIFEDFFDAVVIIRGGGAQSDLNCFNGYWLASNICQFPLPVLTGIGHEQDETIADLVAHTRLKTPTAVAEFLISCYQQVNEIINERSLALCDIVTEKVREEKEQLNRFLLLLKPAVKERLATYSGNLRFLSINFIGMVKQLLLKETGAINTSGIHLKTLVKEFLNIRKHGIDLLERKNDYMDPFLILKRGYSVTYYNGKALKSSSWVPKNEVIETKLAEGTITSKTL